MTMIGWIGMPAQGWPMFGPLHPDGMMAHAANDEGWDD